MESYIYGFGLSLWLGVLTSIAPCPLATNIAAISFIGKRSTQMHAVLFSGALYTIGRVLAYIGVGFLVTKSILTIPAVSNFLQGYMNMIIGPLLIIVAIILFDLISFRIGGGLSAGMQKKIEKTGLFGALFLGVIFALTFCPVSAALFFGSLIPIALQHKSTVIFPMMYGAGTAVPVIMFAVVMSFSIQSVGKLFNEMGKIEFWMRRITAVVFTAAGVYLTLKHTLHLF